MRYQKINLVCLLVLMNFLLMSCSTRKVKNSTLSKGDSKSAKNAISSSSKSINNDQYSAENIIPCDYVAPFIFEGCQSEKCYEGQYGLVLAKDVDLMSDIINGKKIKQLLAKEKLVSILKFKILVTRIGKIKVSSLNSFFPQIKPGINILNLVADSTEGTQIACFDKELVAVDLDFDEIVPYEATNWIYVETEDHLAGFIPFSALF